MLFLKNLNWCAGESSYMLILSYGLEGKAIIIAFLWPAEILAASKECKNPQVFLPPSPLRKNML